MPQKKSPSLSSATVLSPVPETTKVLQALALLDQAKRIAVLSAAIAFFGIGNSELNVVK